MKAKKILTILVVVLVLGVWESRPALAGEIIGWGHDSHGQADPCEGKDFVAIAAGGAYGLALKSDGSIVGWGSNDLGQLNVPAGNDFVAIAAGISHGLALKSDGSIKGWGYNLYGEATPPAGNDFAAIAAGGWHSLALKSDGTIVCWGSNLYGEVTPPDGNDFVAITAGHWHSLALRTDGSLSAWGVSDGGAEDYGQVTNTPGGNDYVAIAAGRYHNLALKSDGSMVGWGSNDCTNGPWCGQATPPPGNDYVAIAAGGYHSLAIKSNGSIVGWGENYFDQTTPPAGSDYVAIAAGAYYSLGLEATLLGTAFTYQGRLIDSNRPADGLYDFRFKLYNEAGFQQGDTVEANDVDVVEGYFTVELDFGSDANALKGYDRRLEVIVRPGESDDMNDFVVLSPRQEVKPTPYAQLASTALGLSVAGTETNAVYIDSNGNVGIGTNSPASPLTVEGIIESTAGGVKFPDGTIQTSAPIADGHSLDAADGSPTNVVYVDNTGNVGIGITSPTQKLDVGGNVRGDNLYAYRYYDRNNTAFYVDPDDISYCNDMRASIFYDRENPGYYVNPAGTSYLNTIYAGNVHASIYEDRDDTAYFLDPSGDSYCNIMYARAFRDKDNDNYFVDPSYSGGLCARLAGMVQMPLVYHTSSGGRTVRISNDGTLGTSEASSKRYKEDIAPLIDDFSKILGARTVTFTWKKSKDRGIGLIAEDIDKLGLQDLVIYDNEGRPDGVRYEFISLYLLEVVKELKAENEALKEQIETQNQSVNKRLDVLERIIQQSQLAELM